MTEEVSWPRKGAHAVQNVCTQPLGLKMRITRSQRHWAFGDLCGSKILIDYGQDNVKKIGVKFEVGH